MHRPQPPSADGFWRRWRGVRLAANQGGSFLRAMAEETFRRPPSPQYRGSLRIDGVHDVVEILRDRAGIPHVYGSNADDALFGFGFAQAQDRSWQLEFYRRVGTGRLAEVVGPQALPVDRLMRHVGLHRAADAAWAATPAAVRAGIEPYLHGLRAGMQQTPLPLEVRILNYEPEPWRPEDSVVWAKLVTFLLSPAWEAQIVRACVAEMAGLDAVLAVDLDHAPDTPVIAPPAAPYGALTEDLQHGYAEIVKTTGLGSGGGSNNWAVDAAHGPNGHALLACDPHLSAVVPAFAYFVHAECPEFAVAGAGLPGLPGLVWGFNRRIAWGATAGLAATQDVYVEEFEPGTNRYRTPEGWAEAEEVVERIDVRGHSPETARVRVTRHGPVISPALRGVTHALALRSTVLEPTHAGATMLGLLTAGTMEEFRTAVSAYGDFNLAVAYADVDGHAGIQVAGSVPRRRPGMGRFPLPGWDATADWDGYVPFNDLPHEFEPADGRVWSANNVPAPADRLQWAGEYLDGYRATRIGQVLESRQTHTVAAARALQHDRLSLPMMALRDRLVMLPAATDEERGMLASLRRWDGRMEWASIAAAIMGATYAALLDAVLRAKLGAATKIYLSDAHEAASFNVLAARTASLVERLLEEQPADWFGPARIDGSAVWTAALLRAFRDAIALLHEQLGDDLERWQWGRCHQLTLQHGLAESPIFARLFNLGPFPYGGDANTVCQASPLTVDPFAPVTAIPVLRLIVEMSDPPTAEFALAGGQSGRRGDRHYDDLLDDWRTGRTRPLLTDRALIESDGPQRLILQPQDLAEGLRQDAQAGRET